MAEGECIRRLTIRYSAGDKEVVDTTLEPPLERDTIPLTQVMGCMDPVDREEDHKAKAALVSLVVGVWVGLHRMRLGALTEAIFCKIERDIRWLGLVWMILSLLCTFFKASNSLYVT